MTTHAALPSTTSWTSPAQEEDLLRHRCGRPTLPGHWPQWRAASCNRWPEGGKVWKVCSSAGCNPDRTWPYMTPKKQPGRVVGWQIWGLNLGRPGIPVAWSAWTSHGAMVGLFHCGAIPRIETRILVAIRSGFLDLGPELGWNMIYYTLYRTGVGMLCTAR